MNKRTFLKTSVGVIASGSVLAETGQSATGDSSGTEYFELRTWTLKPGKQVILDEYLSKALIPATARAGSGPVGVMTETAADGTVLVYALIVHPSPDHFATLPSKLAADERYLKDGGEYLAATAADPVYDRVEVSFHRAIAGMPKLAQPDPKQPRLFNLRIYESHNERAAAKKIEMFNTAEIGIFKRVGLNPVFFGQTIAGSRMPNLTYMLVFSGEDARKAAWDTFRADAEWLKLKAVPEYADKEIVSKITNKLLTPLPYSQL